MEQDTEPTLVVFRRWPKKEGGGVIALFPALEADDRGHCTSYEHVGQHGAASYGLVVAQTRFAKPDEPDVVELSRELTQIGYLLQPIKRYGARAQHLPPPPKTPRPPPSIKVKRVLRRNVASPYSW